MLSDRQALNSRKVVLSEAALVAFLTAVLYLAAGAYEIGYQQEFGFTYYSLSVEDVVFISSKLIIPIVLTSGLVSGIVSIKSLHPILKRFDNLLVMYLSVIPCGMISFYLSFYFGSLPSLTTNLEAALLVTAFYYFTILQPITPLWPKYKKPLIGYPSYLLPTVVVATTFIILCGDVGAHDALNTDYFELCPLSFTAISVERTEDTNICATADLAKGLVYSEFTYFKVPEDGQGKTFRLVKFRPKKIGVSIDHLQK